MYVANYITTCSCTDGNIQLQLEHTSSLEDAWQPQSQALAAKGWNGVSCFAFWVPNSNSREHRLSPSFTMFLQGNWAVGWLLPSCSVSPLRLQCNYSWDLAREGIFILLIYFMESWKIRNDKYQCNPEQQLNIQCTQTYGPVFAKRRPFLAVTQQRGQHRKRRSTSSRVGSREINMKTEPDVYWLEGAKETFGILWCRCRQPSCLVTACVFLWQGADRGILSLCHWSVIGQVIWLLLHTSSRHPSRCSFNPSFRVFLRLRLTRETV